MLMWAMSGIIAAAIARCRASACIPTAWSTPGRVALRQVPLEPKAGTHSLVWDEAVKISGADSDFHRRDLWEAIEAVPTRMGAGTSDLHRRAGRGFTFDVLDATKIVPEELVPIVPVGRLVLNRNPDNFFAETEQVAFCVAHVVPASTSRTIRCSRVAFIHRRHADLTLGRSQLPRDSDQCADRAGAQTTSATASSGDPSRPGLV